MTEAFVKSPDGEKKPKRRKRTMRSFKMQEISVVDRGAQEPAVATLLKRKDPELVEKLVLLTSEEDGHQHGVHIDQWSLEGGGGTTTHAGGPDGEGHSHSFVIDAAGGITIGTDQGHTHAVPDSVLLAMLSKKKEELFEDDDEDEDSDDKDKNKKKKMPSRADKKLESGEEFEASDYALVIDPNNSTTWEHRLVRKSGSNPDRRLVGNAVVALKQGRIPVSERETFTRRLRLAWLKANVGKSRSQMPPVLKRMSVTT